MHWAEIEDDILIKKFNKLDKEQIMELLPKRTWGAIRNRAYKKGLIIPGRRMTNYKPPLDRAPELHIPPEYRYWLAAAMDSEGTIGMLKADRINSNRTYYIPYFSFGNTNLNFVNIFKERSQMNHRKIEEKTTGYTNNYYKLETQNTGYIYSILKIIEPYLIVKKRCAQLLIEFIKIEDTLVRNAGWRGRVNYTKKQYEIFNKIRELNKRGEKL